MHICICMYMYVDVCYVIYVCILYNIYIYRIKIEIIEITENGKQYYDFFVRSVLEKLTQKEE